MARYRVCAEPGCPNYTEGHTRCADCRTAHEKQRGTKHQRGYDAEFQRAAKALRATNPTHCEHCGEPFTKANPMQAGHAVGIRHGGTADEGLKAHCRACNAAWRRTGL